MAMQSLENPVAETETSGRPIRYRELLRSNADYRNLWLGQIISELGDWFALVSLLNIMLELTGRAQVVGWFFIIVHVPSLVLGPYTGVLIDRLDRKKIMIGMDLTRAAIVLGYLLVRRPEQIWIIYVIAMIEVTMTALFEPARTAIIPTVCSQRELVAANALSSITWSAGASIGAAAGGFAAAVFGREVCFFLDSLSFLASAAWISRVRLPRRTACQAAAARGGYGFESLVAGLRYLLGNRRVLALFFVKTGWCLGSGILLLLSVFGERVFRVAGSGAAGIGLLYGARGIGTVFGPLMARRLSREVGTSMRRSITAGFFLGSVAYVAFSRAPTLPLAAAALLFAHAGGSITWVFSTVLLQMRVPDEYRGRVFALELTLFMLAIALSNYVTGYCLDIAGLSPRTVATLIGLYFLVPALLWMSAQRFYRD